MEIYKPIEDSISNDIEEDDLKDGNQDKIQEETNSQETLNV